MSASTKRCESFIEAVCRLVAAHVPEDERAREGLGGGTDPSDDEVLELVGECELTVDDFIELDERPARFDGRYRERQWHRLLRRVRNGRTDDLFAILGRSSGLTRWAGR